MPDSPGLPASLPLPLPLSRPAIADRESLPAIVRANNAFALSLYHRLRTSPGNLLVSPACLSAGLALVHAGARGETARQVASTLHLPDGLARPDRAIASLIQDLNADARDRSYQIRLADALWVQDGFPLLDSYRTTLSEAFALDGTRVDFAGNPAEACRVINAWTGSRTGGKVAGHLSPDDLPPATRLVSTSALYLRASWQERFRKELTKQAPFRVAPGETVEVPMMNNDSDAVVLGYHDGGSFQALELPCGSGGEFAMVVLLPRDPEGLAEFEATLSPGVLEALWPRLRRPEELIVGLPRYRIRSEISLDRLLADLGMPLAFDGRADFSGINGEARDLYLASARHSTYIDVHEEGIEAAAALASISPSSYGEEPPVFRADHPFVFLIRDTRSGCILFLGRVVNPLDEAYEVSTGRIREVRAEIGS